MVGGNLSTPTSSQGSGIIWSREWKNWKARDNYSEAVFSGHNRELAYMSSRARVPAQHGVPHPTEELWPAISA